MTPLRFVEARDLACIRGGRLVFQGLRLKLGAGEILQVEGPNGSGKTSLLRILAGLLSPAKGTIHLQSGDVETTDTEARIGAVGWLGHQDGVKAQLTPRETLAFFARLYRRSADIGRALETVGLARAADLPCQYLSAGQRKRLALARLAISGRSLWLLDEPLAALDAAGRALLLEMLRSHANAGGIAVAATHDPLGIDAGRLQLA